MTHDDRPLDTQTATPPPTPPKRPRVVGALSDDLRDRYEHLQRELQALRDQCDVILAAHRAARERFR